MTPDDARAEADALDERAREAIRRGDEDEAVTLALAAEVARGVARRLEERAGLPTRKHSRSVDREMVAAHRIAISTGRTAEGDELARAAQAAGMSLRTLAKKVGVSPGLLSRARSGEKGLRRDVADKIQRLTGYPASRWRIVD